MKKTLLGLIAFITILLMPITAFAAKENGKCNIIVHYSDFIAPSESDNFTITFKDGSGAEQTFTISAYNLVEATGSIELPVGVYTIVSLKYEGDGKIESYGYAMPTYFTVATDDTKKDIEIAIGHKEIKKMNENEDSLYIKQDNQVLKDIRLLYSQEEEPEDYDPTEHESNNYILYNGELVGADEPIPDNNEDLAELAVATEDEKIGEEDQYIETQVKEEEITQAEPQKEEVKQETTKPNNSHKKSLISRIIVLGLLVVIVGVMLLIMKKQGKI